MFPFWDLAIAPIFDAVDARRVVEIGALRGETTIRMLERLGPDAELHVIDPVPDFDPTEHEQQFPGRYLFHRDLSLNALPGIKPVDVALIDGDHNWYTVYHELQQIAATSRDAHEPLPVFICHDVTWPYGYRDLYYAPDTIPEEHRQPYAQRGIRPNKSELAPGFGGLNPTMNNATHEGGPRNGVMCAIEDFLADAPEDLELLVLPIYFGLAIIYDRTRLTTHPQLADVIDHLTSTHGKDQLLELAEDTRLRAMLFQHNVLHHRDRQLSLVSGRYLELLKRSLLDDLYLENEIRIDYLVHCLAKGRRPEEDLLRDPTRLMRDRTRELRARRQTGDLAAPGEAPDYFPYTTMGRHRLDHLEACLDDIRTEAVPGDLVEVGTGRGGGAIFLRGYLDAHTIRHTQVWVADRFAANLPVDEPDEALPAGGHGFPQLGADLNGVRDGFHRFDLLDDRVHLLQGDAAATLADAPIDQVALLRIGPGPADQAAAALEALHGRISPGGWVIVDNGRDDAVRAAVEEFRARHGVTAPLARIDWAGLCWQVEAPSLDDTADTSDTADADEAAGRTEGLLARAPLAPPPGIPRKDLSVVVVFYNMRREAERTLHSLSRAYQQGVDDLDYEVIAVENGSDPEQCLGRDLVQSFGAEFRYLDLKGDAHPSPVHALNEGIRRSKGEAVMLMIDGAHVLTPGVLRFGMLGLRTYAPSIVSTQQWYVGPGQQGEAMAEGYDQAFEDRLFAEVEWPKDGYRLFDIGHFIGERDWLDGMWESNALFVPRALLSQVGGYDESFDLPGGEYANLDIYERLASSPDVSFTTILGEGSFHQVHGGTTTNQTDDELRRRRIASYAQHFAELRGRAFRGHNKRIHYVGTMIHEANRTRARRRVSPNYFRAGAVDDPDGKATTPVPVPEELEREYLDAFWRSLRWRKSSWLGRTVGKSPTDLFVYQELISELRPNWVIETGPGGGGRALYLATVCDLLGHGQVLSVGQTTRDDLPSHERLRYLSMIPLGSETHDAVREIVGDDPRALVILGSTGQRQRMIDEFETFVPFVPVGSYVIFENTIVNGHPVWASFGPGPTEAVKLLLGRHPEFAIDTRAQRYGLTFNPGGFLKHVG